MADETNALGSSASAEPRSDTEFDDALDDNDASTSEDFEEISDPDASGGTSDVLTGSDVGSGDREDSYLTSEGDNDTGEISAVGSDA